MVPALSRIYSKPHFLKKRTLHQRKPRVRQLQRKQPLPHQRPLWSDRKMDEVTRRRNTAPTWSCATVPTTTSESSPTFSISPLAKMVRDLSSQRLPNEKIRMASIL